MKRIHLQIILILLLLVLIILLRNKDEHLTRTKTPVKKVVKKPVKKVVKKPGKKAAKKPAKKSRGGGGGAGSAVADSGSGSSDSNSQNKISIHIIDKKSSSGLLEVGSGTVQATEIQIIDKTYFSKGKIPPIFKIRNDTSNKILQSINATLKLSMPSTNTNKYKFKINNDEYEAINNKNYDIPLNLAFSNLVTIDFTELFNSNISITIQINSASWR